MRFLLIALIVAALGAAPFAMLRRPWALRIWEKVKLLVVAYVIVIIVSSVYWLITRWDAIYG